MKKSVKKSLTLAAKLRRNLRMGKVCRVEFIKVEDGKLTRRYVRALSSENIRGTGRKKPNKALICFFDITKDDIRCCRAENLRSVQTMAQVKREEIARDRYNKAIEVAEFYDLSVRDAWPIVLDKKALNAYEAHRLEDYYESGEYGFDAADAKHDFS
ncbi:SH3 beta-barrel fold-containing protein [Runella sp.]|uniref:SH3 beta-barrel fold-containing protein n=1 Tax=Runella sp. TaxID=1960881 RepID=UPI003D0FA780